MNSDENIDYSEIQSALESIGLSAVLIVGATLLSQGFGLLTRITMARYLPIDGYGNVVIGLSVLNLFGLVALAGMPAALSRYLPRQDTADERRSILSSAFQVAALLSASFAVGIYLTAQPLAMFVFGNEDLVEVIRIFAGILPFFVLLRLSLGGFRGYETTLPRILTQNVLRPGLQLAGVILFVGLGYGTTGIAFSYVAAFSVVSVVGLLLLYRVSEFSPSTFVQRQSIGQYRELLTFSIPLVASGAVNIIAKHSDIVILGIYKSSSQVGLYEVAFRIGLFIPTLFMPAIGFLYQPIMSRFHANNSLEKMSMLYTIATRWMVVGAFPVFVLFFMFPEQTLEFLFGPDYTSGRNAFRVLVVGFMIALFPGLNGPFLTAVGKTKLLMYISVANMFLNLSLNVVLIPSYGIIGAAVATISARIFVNATKSIFIYRIYGIHPVSRNYVLPTLLIGVVFISSLLSPVQFDSLTFLQGFVVAAGFGLLYLLFIFVTKSIYGVELELLKRLLEKAGIKRSIYDIFQRFVR